MLLFPLSISVFHTHPPLMELQAFSLIVVFSFSLFYLSLCYLKAKIWCNCDICQTYLTSSWTKQFDNLCDWYAHLLRNSPGKTIHIHVLRNTITASPENVEYILRTRFENFPKGKAFSTILGDLLGRGIFNVDGDMWKFQRKMARLELDRNSVRSYAFDLVNSEIQTRLVPVLSSFAENQTQVDLQDLFKRFSLDTICRFSFGLDPKCLELSLPLSEFAVAFDLASKLSAERALTVSPLVWKVKRMLNVGSERKLRESLTMINALAEEVIRTKRKLGISNSNDLLSRFMKTVNDDVYLRDIVISFLLAGRDTVASSLTSLFLLLCKNPEVMTRIREEADRVIGSDREFSSYEHLRELHYLHAAVYESMRMYPPIQFDSKFCKEDDVLPDGSVFVGR